MTEQGANIWDRLPPRAIEAERALIGSVLLDDGVLADVAVDRDDFFVESHGEIWKAIEEVHGAAGRLDPLLIARRLEDLGVLERVGGPEYLVELAEGVPNARHAEHYARIIRDKARLRRLIEASAESAREAFEASEPADVIADRAEGRLFEAGRDRTEDGGAVELGEAVSERVRAIAEARERGVDERVLTQYKDLDRLIPGWPAGGFVVLGARPSMGKTQIAVNMMLRLAQGGAWARNADRARSALFASLEMSRESVAERFLSTLSGVPMPEMKSPGLSLEDLAKLGDAEASLSGLPIVIDDAPRRTVPQIRARARRELKRRGGPSVPGGLALIVVDYLQLVGSTGKKENRQVEVADISKDLKAMARELGVCVVAVVQLNREAASSSENRPRLTHIRESGGLEQDADIVMLLHREAYYHNTESQADREWKVEHQNELDRAELIIAKQRNGPTGTVFLHWNDERGLFGDWSPRHEYGRGMGAEIEVAGRSREEVE